MTPLTSGTCWRIALTLVVLAATSACGIEPSSAARRLAIATGDETGVYYLLGGALADVYSAGVPGVTTSVVKTTGSGFNVRAVEEGRAELAFSQADVAYLAVQQGTDGRRQPYRNVRAMAVLYVNAVQIVALKESNIRRLEDLDGRRVGIGASYSGTEVAARIILKEGGLDERIVPEPRTFEDVISGMQGHEIDAGFVVSSYPVPAVARLNTAAGVRLIPIGTDLAKRIRASYPFYRPIVVPDGTYGQQGGDVPTIGVDNLLVCRSDLPDELVYQLTRRFFETLPQLTRAHSAAAAINPERASAAPIPLHPGAARYYRERDLFR